METFGEWLREQRSQRRLTREQVAGLIGCSVSALRKIEAGERRPSVQIAELIANWLVIPPADRSTFVRVARGLLRVERLPAGAVSATAASATLPRNNLPVFPSPLIGREPEVDELCRILGEPRCRLLTLVGPGGIGKTRLAIEAGARLQDGFADGVYFVSLAPVTTVDAVILTVANAVRFSFSGSSDPRVQLLNHLRDKQILLIMDNLEQLLGDGRQQEMVPAFLVEILGTAPQVKLLATSRESLELRDEWVFEVHGLPVPESIDAETGAQGTSAELFLQRARRANVGFNATPEDFPPIVQVCKLVDGMPLGIELAAAWVRTLSCGEIAREIERGVGFLNVSARDVPARHRSIQAVFEHSWMLLRQEEQEALLRLSIFRGGFKREAAAEVARADITLLSGLLDKSFIRRTPAARYEIHELLRQYAELKGSENPRELEDAGHRHSGYYAGLVQRLLDDLISARQMEALAETSAEMDNIRAAWQLAVQSRAVEDIHKFIRGLWQYYEIRGWFKEGEATFRLAMERIDDWPRDTSDAEPAVVVLQEFLRAHYTWFSMRLGHWGEAGRLAQECVNQLRSREAWPELAAVLHMAGVALWGTGRYAEARELLEEKIALEEQSGHPWDLAMGWGQLGLIVQGMGDYYNAREYMGRADKFIRECGDTRMLAVSLYHRAGVEFDLGELEAARQMLVQSLELSTVVGDRWIMCTSRLQLGLIAQAQGDHEEAVDWFLDSMGFFRETGEYRSKVQASTALGASLLALGDVEGADRALREALTSAFEAELWPETLAGLVAFAGLQANKGDDAGALVTLEQATRHPACSPATRDQMVNLRSESEARLTSQQMQEVLARAEGEPFDAYVRKLLETAE